MYENDIQEKECSKCHEPFLATEEYFYPDAKSPDGLRAECRWCTCNSNSINYYDKQQEILDKRWKAYQDNPEPKRAYMREYMKAYRKQKRTAAAC